LNIELEFFYTDSVGNKSERLVKNIRVVKSDTGHVYYKAYDINAGGVRSFRVDRIKFKNGIAPDWLSELPMHDEYLYQSREDQLKLAVCFTGFPRKDALPFLQQQAIDAGMVVRKSVTNDLDVLVTGYNAGPKKLEKAHALVNCIILSEEGFLNLIETGEIENSA